MANFADVLQGFSSLVIDYSALIELVDPVVQNSLITTIINQNKTVFISKSFKAFHESVIRAQSPNEAEVVAATKDSIHRLVEAKLLRASKSASTVDFFLEHLKNEDECLLIGRNSTSFMRLRNINANGLCSVFVVDDGNIRFYPDVNACMEKETAYSVNPIAGNADYIAVDIYFSVGDVLYTDENEQVRLQSLISTGAEGLVFNTNMDGFVAKVYHRGGITPLRWSKLMKMRDLGIQAQNICWPYKLLFSNSKVPVGYLMRKAEGVTISRAFDGPDAMNSYFPSWMRLHVVDSALSFLHIMDYLHLHGVLVGDIQLKNAMIDDEEHVYLIDIDSVQYQDLPCPVGTEEFTRPELWNKSFVSFLRRPQDEDYSISILVFSMLFCGQHPYAQRNGLETLRDEMEARSFPYTVDDSQVDRIPIGGYDKIWDALTPTLKDMFVRAFSKGELFDSVEWTVALTAYRDLLEKHEIEDEEYYNVFPYFVDEAEEPVKKKSGGKVSVREAVMNSNWNTADNADLFEKQMGAKEEEHRPQPRIQNTPKMSGSTSGYVPKPKPAPRPTPSASDNPSPFAARTPVDKPYGGNIAPSSYSSPRPTQVPQKSDSSSVFSKSKMAALLLILLGIALIIFIFYLTN